MVDLTARWRANAYASGFNYFLGENDQPRRIGLGDDRNRTSGPLFPGRTGPEFDPESGYRPMTTHGSGFRFARSATKET